MEITQPSILISSSDPAKLARFYSLVMNTSLCNGLNENHYEIKCQSNIPISFYKPSRLIDGSKIRLNALSICFQRKSSKEPLIEIQKWIEELISYGAQLLEGPIEDFFGAEASIRDLDGNTFVILVPLKKVSIKKLSS